VTRDTTYGTEENSVAREDQHIRAYEALADNNHRTEFLARIASVMKPSEISISVQQAKNSAFFRRNPLRDSDAIGHEPKTAITVRIICAMYHQQTGAQPLLQRLSMRAKRNIIRPLCSLPASAVAQRLRDTEARISARDHLGEGVQDAHRVGKASVLGFSDRFGGEGACVIE
jgi:hypothetical protein